MDLYVWVMEAPTKKGHVPVGMVVGRDYIHNSIVAGYFTWFPWASKRNVYESAIDFIDKMRIETAVIFHVEEKDKEFANWVARHGIARRVGTLYDLKDKPIAEFQSRRPKWANIHQ